MNLSKQWTVFTIIVAFSMYWASNLILWFPWSISPALGITLMLTVTPFLWGFGIFQSLKKYPGPKLLTGALLTSLIFMLMAVVSDYIFFGIIRNAMHDLYRPATFYGYLFVISLPFIEVLLLKKYFLPAKNITQTDVVKNSIPGLVSLAAIIIIMAFNITI